MSTTNKIFQVSGVTDATAIIEPAFGEQFTMSQMVIHNTTSDLGTFKIYVNETQVYEQAVPAKNSFTIQGPWTLEHGDVVSVEDAANAMTFTAFGILITT